MNAPPRSGPTTKAIPQTAPNSPNASGRLARGTVFLHPVSLSGPGQDHPQVMAGNLPMKDMITVHPEKMPATPSPATALEISPVSAGRTSGMGKWANKWPDWVLTGLPPGRRLWEQLRRSGSPARRGRWRPRTPTSPVRVHPSQSRSATEPLVCRGAAGVDGVREEYSTHIKAFVDASVRRLERWDDARNVRGACKVFGRGAIGGVVGSPVLVRK